MPPLVVFDPQALPTSTKKQFSTSKVHSCSRKIKAESVNFLRLLFSFRGHSPHWLLARGDEWASNHFEHIFSTVHAKADPRVWPLWDPSQRVRKRIIIGFCDRARVKKGLQRPQKICALCSWSIMRTNGFIMIFRLKKHFLWFNFGERIIYWLVRGT